VEQVSKSISKAVQIPFIIEDFLIELLKTKTRLKKKEEVRSKKQFKKKKKTIKLRKKAHRLSNGLDKKI
jgi:hypothetical protein